MKLKAFFPNQIWDGKTGSRDHDPLDYDLDPSNKDWDRIVAEVIAIEEYILSNPNPGTTPSFPTFSISSQSTAIEVGTIIPAGDYTFLWTSLYPDSIIPDSIQITDTTNNIILGSGISDTGSQILTLPDDISYSTSGSNIWTISASDFNMNAFSKSFIVNWMFNVFYGVSSSSLLDEAGIKSLTPSLRSAFNGTYSLDLSFFKFFCFPDSYGSPSLFKNSVNQFPIDMAQVTDDSFFSNTANGYSYGLVDLTNDNEILESYRVYRTHYQLGGAINIAVS